MRELSFWMCILVSLLYSATALLTLRKLIRLRRKAFSAKARIVSRGPRGRAVVELGCLGESARQVAMSGFSGGYQFGDLIEVLYVLRPHLLVWRSDDISIWAGPTVCFGVAVTSAVAAALV